MTEAPLGSSPDPAIAFANLLRSSIRAIAPGDRQHHIRSMVSDLTEFQEQLTEHDADIELPSIFDRAIDSLVQLDEQTALVEAQLEFAVSGMQVLADLSSTDEGRHDRLAQNRKQLRNDLMWLDQVRAGFKLRKKVIR